MSTIQETIQVGAPERVSLAHDTFNSGLFALSSFGVDSAVMLRVIQMSGVQVPIIALDTGFWFPETHSFKDALAARFNLEVIPFGPTPEEVAEITATNLWETDPEAYGEITKKAPLRRAIGELGVTGLLSGVRHDQTTTRAGKQFLEWGEDGEVRIHPLLDWGNQQVEEFLKAEQLPRHPLYAQGYGSVGDWTNTSPGTGREGRELVNKECGLHSIKPTLFTT